MRLVDSAQMRDMDQYTIDDIGVPSLVLMENAARSWVEATMDLLPIARRIFVFCGSGNNGGDGYAIARIIKNLGMDCEVVSVKSPKTTDCVKNATIWDRYGKSQDWQVFNQTPNAVLPSDILVDAVLGTGIKTQLRGDLPEILSQIDNLPGVKLAVDMPSGISACSGDKLGAAIKAERTVTFQKEKVGQHLYPGKSYAGRLVCQKISIQEVFKGDDQPFYLVDKAMAKALLPSRKPDVYKNVLGHALIWCGAPGTLGAAVLASQSCMKSGVGLVTAALPEEERSLFITRSPELMTTPNHLLSAERINQFDSLVLGCGLGREPDKWKLINDIVRQVNVPTVFDADAFYGMDNWRSIELTKAVLTPHAGEFAKLSGYPKPASNAERIEQGLMFIKRFPTTLVLKGAPTLIFSQTGEVFINSTGNNGMATAGSGDTLAGMIGGWLAQGLNPLSAAQLAVWTHGRSGDFYTTDYNEESLTATDLIAYISAAISELK